MGLMRTLCCCFGNKSGAGGESGQSRSAYRKCPDEEQECETETPIVQPADDNEIEQSLAAAISDRATDEVLEALTRYRRGLGISESPSVLLDEPQTPDIVRSRSSHEAEGLIIRPGGRGSVLPKLGLESPTKLEYLNLATPHLPTKRRSVARKVRPQSVVENLSLSHIPDLLESPSSHRSSSQLSARAAAAAAAAAGGASTAASTAHMSDSMAAMDDGGVDECCDSITELPSASFQLQHLVKGRPKRAKTRAPTRPLVNAECAAFAGRDIGDGLEHFFRPGSVTPTTLTPLVSPTSEECSSLSFVDSPTMSRDGNGHMTSEETTPILEERRPIKLERQSPLLKSASWATRSRSTDNLEKYSPLVGRKSPLVKMRTEANEEATLPVPKPTSHNERMRSPSSDSIRNHVAGMGSVAAVGVEGSLLVKTGNGILRTPIALQKPRPWSVVGSEPKVPSDLLTGNGNGIDSNKTTPDMLEEDVEVVPFGAGIGGSIVGIAPGIALSASSGGSIVGISPGAALEKKSVRELAAGLSRLDLPLKPPIMPRTMLSQSSVNRTSNGSTISSSNNNNSMTTTTTTTTTVLNNQTRSKIISTSSTNSETQETLSKTIITEQGSSNNHAQACANLISNEILSMRNGQLAKTTMSTSTTTATSSSSCAESNVMKRIAGKEISTLFEV